MAASANKDADCIPSEVEDSMSEDNDQLYEKKKKAETVRPGSQQPLDIKKLRYPS